MSIKRERSKRKNGELEDPLCAKRARDEDVHESFEREQTIGKVKHIFMRNFMCHDALAVDLNANVNFIVGRNGSGKSAILTALVVGLGGKARLTNRGNALKGFIKNGKNSGTVEITLTNAGAGAYKSESYGDTITVCRTLGTTSSYKIKNWRGEVISHKKEDLDKIIEAMNIQIDNPISVLNQDVSRSFLVSSTPGDKYNLFMKATRLDLIGKNYLDAHQCNEDSRRRLIATEEVLAESIAEIEQLQQRLQMLESIDEAREQYKNLQIELQWAIVIAEEMELNRMQERLSECEAEVKKLETADEEREMKMTRIRNKIEELNTKLQESKDEATNSAELYKTAKSSYLNGKEMHSTKVREWQTSREEVKRIERDILLLRKEIERLEAGSSTYEAERQQAREKLGKLEQNLDEIQATLRTKQTDQMHLEADIKEHLIREEHSSKIKVESCRTRIWQISQKLAAIKRQSDNAMTVYSPNMPRLLKRIDEEFRKGRFKEKPRGPVGAFIKLNDQHWIPAVENFLSGLLSAFCVDNTQDAKKLGMIMREVFRDERCPQIISSKFYDKVHDVEKYCTRSRDYPSLLEMMEISDPVIANCLIDQREIECVLLIPTSDEACSIMCETEYVPRNCKKAFTQQGDLFFPAPNYKTYGGKRGMRARFLQVSTTQAIQNLEEELMNAEKEQQKVTEEFNSIINRLKVANSDLKKTNEKVFKLRTMEGQLKNNIAALKDKLDEGQSNSIEVFTSEMDHLRVKHQKAKTEEDRLKKEISDQQTNLERLDAECKRCRDIVNNIDFKLNPIKEEITQLNQQRENLHSSFQNAARKLQIAKDNVKECSSEFEKQLSVVDATIKNASEQGERVDTPRSPKEILRTSNEIQASIEMMEREYGSKEDLERELQKKQENYNQINDFAITLRKSCEQHQKRLKRRKQLFHEMKDEMGNKIQLAFQSILHVRKYKGMLKIDHSGKLLHLEINPQNDAKRPTNNAKSLSGGERSYSTVAFILALWDCIQLPFYFLDEFDVFMDKVNRRVIMDILIEHTRSHPESQFAFLTPLDTSSIQVDDYITVHRLAPPERLENTE